MVFYIASLCARTSFSFLKNREWYIHMQRLGNSNEYLFLLSTWIFFSFIFEESVAYNQAYSIYKTLYIYIYTFLLHLQVRCNLLIASQSPNYDSSWGKEGRFFRCTKTLERISRLKLETLAGFGSLNCNANTELYIYYFNMSKHGW